MRLEHIVTTEEDGRELLNVLRRGMGLSSGMVKRLKRGGGLSVGGEPRYTNYVVRAGEVVTVFLDRGEPETGLIPETGSLEILHEDEHLLAVNKPAGIIVHPSRAKHTGTLANYAAGYLQSSGAAPLVHAANRLDRDTSGVVLFAKSSHAKAVASKALKGAEKIYLAVVCWKMPVSAGVIDLPIARLKRGDMLRAVSPGGQRAVTRYETVKTLELPEGALSVLKLRLETGRTHQIRVHCTHLGCPLLGDTLYKTEASEAMSRRLGVSAQLLHAQKLSFPHPISGERLTISCRPRKEFTSFIGSDPI